MKKNVFRMYKFRGGFSKILKHRVICVRLPGPALSYKPWLPVVLPIQGAHAQMYADIFVP